MAASHALFCGTVRKLMNAALVSGGILAIAPMPARAGGETISSGTSSHATHARPERRALRTSSLHKPRLTSAPSVTQASVQPSFFDLLADLFEPDPFGGNTESACSDAEQAVDVGKFTGSGAFTPELTMRQTKATVRISLKSPEEVERILREELHIAHYDMGVMKKLWNKSPVGFGGGFCTGTLLLSNIVLSAGHCIAYQDYLKKKLKPPAILNADGTHRRYMSPDEFAMLLKVDFNFQYLYVSSNDPFAVSDAGSGFSVPVTSLAKSRFGFTESGVFRDYMLLRIGKSDEDLGKFAIGLRNIDAGYLPSNAPLAIVQHPRGDYKKIAAGNLQLARNSRLYYSNLDTDGGSSGAGIINKSGKLVGIHTEGGCRSTEDGNANKGWSISTIKPAIDALTKK